jgi:hypothetical protein
MKCSDGDRLGFSVGLGSRNRSTEYPCVSRLCQRRLLSLLNRQEMYDTFDACVRILFFSEERAAELPSD